MERLTGREKAGNAYFPRCFEEPCVGMGCQMDVCHFLGQVCDRLAAYEDTGLEPEEISALESHKLLDEYERGKLFEYQSLGCTIDYLRELIQAEKDRRLVVLPVPVGTGKIVYMVYEADNGERRIRTIECDRLDSLEIWDNPAMEVVIEADGWEIGASDVGKTVFLTYEEAEAALEGGDEG